MEDICPGQFLACSFWLVSAPALNGRVDEARALFDRLLGLANDLGLLAAEYDVARKRQVGNFPQAFTPGAPMTDGWCPHASARQRGEHR